MLYRRGSSVKSSFSNFRLIINVMSSKAQRLQDPVVNECQTRKGQCYCFKESISETVPSVNCDKINHENTNDGSQGCASELTELLCDKLTQGEKRIYFAHQHAVMIGQSSYIDPSTGYTVFTEEFLKKRRTCCGSGCRHCPYKQDKVPEGKRKKFNSAFFT